MTKAKSSLPPKPASYTPENLLPVYRSVFSELQGRLPSDLAATLRSRRSVERHGTCSTVLLWTIWHARQHREIIPPVYTAWSIIHDPGRFETRSTDWMVKFQVNTVRIYTDRLDPRSFLLEALPSVVPRGFTWQVHPRFLAIEYGFQFEGAPDSLPDLVLGPLERIIRSVHPVLESLLDQLGDPMPKHLRREFIESRKKIHARAGRGQGAASRHSISKDLTQQVLKRHRRRCALCHRPLQSDDAVHIDHIIPFSKGGLTVLENLQPTHADCNLRKGRN